MACVFVLVLEPCLEVLQVPRYLLPELEAAAAASATEWQWVSSPRLPSFLPVMQP